MKRKIYILYILSLLCLCAMADDIELQMDSIVEAANLRTVVVTGTRTPKLLKDTPIQTRVITSADIKKTDATNVQDLLQQEMPGIEFSYALNQQVNMNVSGFAGQGVLLLVDGERLAGETMDNVDFSRLTLDGIERIEIVKGAASALYGSNATGGVINIITRKEQQPWSLSLNSRIGQHAQMRHGLTSGLSLGRFENTLSVLRSSMDNYTVEGTGDPAQAEGSVFHEVYGDKVWNVKEKLVYKPIDQLRLTARAGYFYRTLERTIDNPERYRDFNGGLRGEWSITDKDNLELSYAFDQYDKSDYQRLRRLDIRRYSNVQNSVRGLYTHSFNDRNILTVGGDYIHDYLFNRNLDRSPRQDLFDLFAQYDWSPAQGWEIVGAARYDYISQGHRSQVTPKISARYQYGDLTLRCGYGMGFRAPTLKERYYDFDMIGIWIIRGNQQLKAETSHNVNLSAEYSYKGYYFNLSANYSHVANRITTGIPHYDPQPSTLDPNPLPLGGGRERGFYLDYVNLGNMDVFNLEASVQKAWACGLSARISYNFNYEHLQQRAANQYMPTRPHSLTWRLDWTERWNRQGWTAPYALDIILSGRFLSAVDNTEYLSLYDPSLGTKSVRHPAYALTKLQINNHIGKVVTLQLTLDNLLNYRPRYYYFNAPLTTGFNVLAGIIIDLK